MPFIVNASSALVITTLSLNDLFVNVVVLDAVTFDAVISLNKAIVPVASGNVIILSLDIAVGAIKVILLTPLSVSSKKSIYPLPADPFPSVNPSVAFICLYALISVAEYVDIAVCPLVITTVPLLCGCDICKSSGNPVLGEPIAIEPLDILFLNSANIGLAGFDRPD